MEDFNPRVDMHVSLSDRRFIIFDENDDKPSIINGHCISSGIVGLMTVDNLYLTSYAHYPYGAPKISDMGLNECIRNVEYHLSGSYGNYTVMRVL
jgi:hypothetical protein